VTRDNEIIIIIIITTATGGLEFPVLTYSFILKTGVCEKYKKLIGKPERY